MRGIPGAATATATAALRACAISTKNSSIVWAHIHYCKTNTLPDVVLQNSIKGWQGVYYPLSSTKTTFALDWGCSPPSKKNTSDCDRCGEREGGYLDKI